MFKLVRKENGSTKRRVCVVGLGDGGSRAVEGVIGGGDGDTRIAVVNTDATALSLSHAMTKVQIGRQDSQPSGTAGDPLLGKAAAEHDIEMLRGLFSDSDALILAAGLGGGTGSGAAPVLLNAAKSAGVMTFVVVTMPFMFEGESKKAVAKAGLQAIIRAADFVCVIENDRLFAGAGADGDIGDAFARADDALASGICSLWHMLAKPMLIGVDPSVLTGLSSKGKGFCHFGFATASGPGRAMSVAKALKEGPVFEKGEGLRKNGAVLLCVCGSYDMTLQEVSDLVAEVAAAVSDDTDLQISTVINDAWKDRVFAAVWTADRRRTVTPTAVPRSTTRVPTGTKRGTKPPPAQEELPFGTSVGGGGRFSNIAATILDGEDLDTPTYKRLGIVLEK